MAKRRKRSTTDDTSAGWRWDGNTWQPPVGVEPGWSLTTSERARRSAANDEVVDH